MRIGCEQAWRGGERQRGEEERRPRNLRLGGKGGRGGREARRGRGGGVVVGYTEVLGGLGIVLVGSYLWVVGSPSF